VPGAALALLTLFAVALPTPASGQATPVAYAQGGFAESFTLTGLVEKPTTFTEADLAAYPSTTLSVAFGAGQGFQTGRYTGVQLWDLLQEAKVQLDPARNNDRLRNTWS
jgi:DMSO/TMAO reductase YedYZ molybdopterin-dependent catalytic subunit